MKRRGGVWNDTKTWGQDVSDFGNQAKSKFNEAKMLGEAKFNEAKMLGEAKFNEAKAFGEENFNKAKSFGEENLNKAKSFVSPDNSATPPVENKPWYKFWGGKTRKGKNKKSRKKKTKRTR